MNYHFFSHLTQWKFIHFTKHRLTLTDWSERLIICSESFHIPLSYDDKLNDSVCLIGRESRLLLVIDIHFHRANNKRNSHKTNNKRGNGILISLSHRYPNREKNALSKRYKLIYNYRGDLSTMKRCGSKQIYNFLQIMY